MPLSDHQGSLTGLADWPRGNQDLLDGSLRIIHLGDCRRGDFPGSTPTQSTVCATDCEKARTKALESSGVSAATCCPYNTWKVWPPFCRAKPILAIKTLKKEHLLLHTVLNKQHFFLSWVNLGLNSSVLCGLVGLVSDKSRDKTNLALVQLELSAGRVQWQQNCWWLCRCLLSHRTGQRPEVLGVHLLAVFPLHGAWKEAQESLLCHFCPAEMSYNKLHQQFTRTASWNSVQTPFILPSSTTGEETHLPHPFHDHRHICTALVCTATHAGTSLLT